MMTIEETREKILTDDAFVLEEVKRLKYLTGLKRVIRYNLERDEGDLSESVAEHICALCFLAEYFLRLEDVGSSIDKTKVFEHILYHDTDELETGDVPTNKKTETDRQVARETLPQVLEKSPGVLWETVRDMLDEYESQATEETRFVKALDKLEGAIHCFHERQRPIFEHLKFTEEDQNRTKLQYIEPYPIMLRFFQVISKEFRERKFFYEPS